MAIEQEAEETQMWKRIVEAGELYVNLNLKDWDIAFITRQYEKGYKDALEDGRGRISKARSVPVWKCNKCGVKEWFMEDKPSKKYHYCSGSKCEGEFELEEWINRTELLGGKK
jgi:hypothetical protein